MWTQVANLYLTGLDELCKSHFNTLIFSAKRFVDDLCVLHDASLSKEALSDVLNTFDESLTVTLDGDETLSRAHFLDLDLQVGGNHVEYSTYRKRLCLSMYTPFNSCHPKHIFPGIFFPASFLQSFFVCSRQTARRSNTSITNQSSFRSSDCPVILSRSCIL